MRSRPKSDLRRISETRARRWTYTRQEGFHFWPRIGLTKA
jgi:hypothetical protein